jgi:hypothetical protein
VIDLGHAPCASADQATFFPVKSTPAMYAEARQICSSCAERAECLEQAVEEEELTSNDLIFGMRAGLTPKERYSWYRSACPTCGDRPLPWDADHWYECLLEHDRLEDRRHLIEHEYREALVSGRVALMTAVELVAFLGAEWPHTVADRVVLRNGRVRTPRRWYPDDEEFLSHAIATAS